MRPMHVRYQAAPRPDWQYGTEFQNKNQALDVACDILNFLNIIHRLIAIRFIQS